MQDYQLQLVPKMLRELRPDLTIGFFLHIPFPPVELFMQCRGAPRSWKDCSARTWWDFIWPAVPRTSCILARRLIGANTSRRSVGVRSRLGEVEVGVRTVRVGAFPISIDSAELDQQGP